MSVSLLTLFLSTVSFWWDEVIAPIVRTERPRIIDWIIKVPWYGRVIAGMIVVMVMVGETAFKHIGAKDDQMESMSAELKKRHGHDVVCERLGDLLGRAADLRNERINSEDELKFWIIQFDSWREHTLQTLYECGLRAEYALFQNADAAGHPAIALDNWNWKELVNEYDVVLARHQQELQKIIERRVLPL